MSANKTSTESKVAVITGSAAGLGNGIATRLAEDGFKIVLHDIDEDNLKQAEQTLGYRFEVTVVGDVANRDGQFNLVKQAVDKFGRIDVFVNNAGVESVAPFLEIEKQQEVDKLFNINVKRRHLWDASGNGANEAARGRWQDY